MQTGSQLRLQVVAVLLAIALAVPQTLEARFTPTHGSDAFTHHQEVEVGQKAAAEASKQLPILPKSDPITQYVQQLGAKLAADAPGEAWPYSFHVVNQKEINAFALPGGPIYVNLGTIQAADNEAQLAGVMAHEISHVVQRHATRAATKQMRAQVPLEILGAIIGNAGILGQLAGLGIAFGVGSYFLRNSREAENEADLLGTDIMYDTGHDPRQMAVFFQKLEAQGNAGVQFLSDHPNPGNRVQSVDKEIATLPPKHLVEDSPQFDRIKQLAMQRHPLTAQQIQQAQSAHQEQSTGVISGSVAAPNGSLQTLNNNAFQIGYPANWKAYGDVSSSVTIAPEDGVAQNAVAYGVIIDAFQPELNMSLDEATHRLVAGLQQSNPGLHTIGNDELIRISGQEGRSQEMIGASPIKQGTQTLQERDWLVTLQRSDGSVLYLVFIAPEKDFSKLRPTFEQMLRSLKLW
ncbi:MAG: M48 family metallopeptidase [Acidobacteriota bacterium]|nr:M48 family metallopeptidase [Acidobacteriota bacterium]